MLVDPLSTGFEFPIPDDRWWWLVYIPSRWVRRNSSRVPTFVATYSIKRGWIWCTRSSLQHKSSEYISRWNFICMFTFLLKKLPEGNAFSFVCVPPGDTLPMWPLPMMPAPLGLIPPRPVVTPGSQDWRLVQTCSCQAPCWYWHLVATKTVTVGKRAVRILLECFLLVHRFVPSQAHFEFLLLPSLP